MYDRETGTLWSQLLGEAVAGELIGTKLEFLPAVMTTWASWREMHPDTLAINKGFFGKQDPYLNYYYSEDAGVIGSTNFDERLGTKEFVIGVEIGKDAVAYPFSVLNSQPVVNDEISGNSIVVVFDQENGAGAVWDRSLPDAHILEFVHDEGFLMKDTETGSVWNGLTGQAISGELEGATLTRVKSTQSFWFGWVDFHEDTLIYGFD